MSVDYRNRVSMPIRDMHNDGAVVFWVDVYGVEPRDLCLIPGGSEPMLRAVERLGLDPYRYQALIWDVPIADAEKSTSLCRARGAAKILPDAASPRTARSGPERNTN